MHKSSFDTMTAFVRDHLGPLRETPLRVMDLGSMDHMPPEKQGSYRSLIDAPAWDYVGVDMEPGPNVSVVLDSPYRWSNLATESMDVVISGQTFEHVALCWLTMLEIARVMRPGGRCCIIAPSGGHEHRYPVDCWRIYPDGFRALAAWAGLEVLEARANWNAADNGVDDSHLWADCVLIARKPAQTGLRHFKDKWRRVLVSRLLGWLFRGINRKDLCV